MKQVGLCVALVALSFGVAFEARAERDVSRRVRIATEVIEDRMLSPGAVPQYILDGAQCAASVKIVKAGFIFGGEGSTGLVSCRTPEGAWSAPSFLNVGGVNFGLQIGVQFLETVMLFMTDYGRRILDNASFKMGLDIGFAAGPVGAGGGTGVIPKAHVLTYDRAVGLYVGVTVDGVVMSHGHGRNRQVYGPMNPRDILQMPGGRAPRVVEPYVDVLERYAP